MNLISLLYLTCYGRRIVLSFIDRNNCSRHYSIFRFVILSNLVHLHYRCIIAIILTLRETYRNFTIVQCSEEIVSGTDIVLLGIKYFSRWICVGYKLDGVLPSCFIISIILSRTQTKHYNISFTNQNTIMIIIPYMHIMVFGIYSLIEQNCIILCMKMHFVRLLGYVSAMLNSIRYTIRLT